MPTPDPGEFALTYPSDFDIQITRQFAAPREQVFAAFATCDHLMAWLGPSSRPMTACEMDLRAGGRYQYTLTGPDGSELTFHGAILEADPPARIVQTFKLSGAQGDPSIDTITFTERDGVTTMVSASRYASRQARDAMAQPGFEAGLRDSYNRLEALLARLSRSSR